MSIPKKSIVAADTAAKTKKKAHVASKVEKSTNVSMKRNHGVPSANFLRK